ncbi:hypothetical protein BH09BAC1_BH09BAC1_12420 [soil metagenome]
MKKTIVVAAYLLIIVSVLNTGCKKFRENRQYDSVFDHSAAESSYHDIFRVALQTIGPGNGFIHDNCITKTAVNGGYLIAFGDSCTDLYNISRKGTMSITSTGDINTEGSVTTISPSNLVIEGFKVEGALVVTTLPINSDGKRQFKFVVTNAIVTDGEGNNSQWSCDRVYKQRDEKEPLIIFDDIYTITGTATGTDREERFYETTISEPLVYEIICRWPHSGKASMKIADLKDRDIAYGDDFCEDNADCCDNIVDVEVGGKRERTVKLK